MAGGRQIRFPFPEPRATATRRRPKSNQEIEMEAAQPAHLLNPRQLAKFLNCSVGHCYRLVEQRRIPFVRIGGSVRFRPEAIQSWVSRQEVTSVSRTLRVAGR